MVGGATFRMLIDSCDDLEMVAEAADGQSNHEIAGKLVVSPLTVRTHIQRAMTKLNARDRAQLVVIAYQSGLVRRVTPPKISHVRQCNGDSPDWRT